MKRNPPWKIGKKIELQRISAYPDKNQLENAEQDGKSEDDEPDNMYQKESLSRERGRTAISHLTETQFGNFSVRTARVHATTPVGHAVRAAHRVGSEAFHGARRRGIRRRDDATYIRIIVDDGSVVGGQSKGRRLVLRSDGGEGGEYKDGEEDEEEEIRTCGFRVELVHGWMGLRERKRRRASN